MEGNPDAHFEFAVAETETGSEPQQQNQRVRQPPCDTIFQNCDAQRRRRHVRDTDAVDDIRGPGGVLVMDGDQAQFSQVLPLTLA